MKNYFGYKLLTVIMVVSVVLSSCVDDEVAPEVSALRQAQVDMLNSKTAMQDLENAAQAILNDFTEAMNALKLQSEENKIAQQEMALTHQEALNALAILRVTEQDAYTAAMNALNLQDREADLAYNEAMRALALLSQEQQASYDAAIDSINVARMELQLEEDLAWFEVQTKEYEMQLIQAELDLEKALADMAKYVATSGLENAGEYMDKYGWAMTDYYMLAQQVVGKQTDIAKMELMLGENPDVTGYYEGIAEMLQKQVDEQTTELTALQTLLSELTAVAADPTTAEAAIISAKAKILSLSNANAQLYVDREKHLQDVVEVAQDELDEAYNTINTYDWAKNDIENREQWIENLEENIANYESDIEYSNERIAIYEAQLVTREAILATTTEEYEKQEALREEAYEVLMDAQDARDLAWNNLELAGIANQALWNDYTEAYNKYWDAQNAFYTAEGELNNAEQALANANDYYEANYTTFETELATAETAEAAALTALNAAQDAFDASPTNANLTVLQNARSDYNAAMSTTEMWQSNIEWLDEWLSDAKEALPEAKTALATAESNLAAATTERDAANTAYYEVGNPAQQAAQEAYNKAQQDYSNVNSEYSNQYWLTRDVEDLMNLAQQEVDWRNNNIENYEINIEYYNTRIADYEESIEMYTLQIEGYEATVAALQTAYDALTVEAMYALQEAVSEAWEGYDDLNDQIAANQQMIWAQEDLIWVLENQVNSINNQIEYVENHIAGLMDYMAQQKEALADNAINKTEAMALLELDKEELADLISKRDAALELANKWMELYEAAIAE
ncbi:hypothetical protein [Draconibacterium sp.]|uniref:hypothetical protein n=1 Tax=Draconibacterium sp. TaxID=1965318 RepID=UPI003562B198